MKKQNLSSAAAELKKTMKISKSKRELARIISENGGWRDCAEFAAQDGDGSVEGYGVKPEWDLQSKYWWRDALGDWFSASKIKNHHQTILSRDEYFHLYPVIETAQEPVVEAKPTIEQLAADYRNLLDFARSKQQEADAAKADADAKLADLVAAGKALGLVLSVAGPEPELVITDWRDLLPGDEVEYVEGSQEWSIGMVGVVQRTDHDDGGNMNVSLLFGDKGSGWPRKWRFIRRP